MQIQISENNRAVTFTVVATNSNARPFHWHLEGDGVASSCFEEEVISGTGNITHTATVVVTVKNDHSVINLKNFRMLIRDGGEDSEVVATSALVVVNVTMTTTTTTTLPPEEYSIGIFWNEPPSRDITEYEPANWINEFQEWYLESFVNLHPIYYNSNGTVNTNKPPPDSLNGLPWKHNYITSQFNFTDNQNRLDDTNGHFNTFYRNYHGEIPYYHTLFFRINKDTNNEPFWFRVAFYTLAQTQEYDIEGTTSFKSFKCENYSSFTPVDPNLTNQSPTYMDDPNFVLEARQYISFDNYEEGPTDIGHIRFSPKCLMQSIVEWELDGVVIDYYDIRSIVHSFVPVLDRPGRAKKIRAVIIQTSKNPNEISNGDTSFDLGVMTSFDFIVSNRIIVYNDGYGNKYHQIDSMLNLVPSGFSNSITHENCNPSNHV